VVHEWFAIHFEGQRNVGVVRLEDFLKRTHLGTRAYPNPGEFEVPIAITSLLPQAVAEAGTYMSDRRKQFQDNLQLRLQEVRAKLLVIVSPEDQVVNPTPAIAFVKILGAPVIFLDSPCGHLTPLGCISLGPPVA
jgi:hypothetical protein